MKYSFKFIFYVIRQDKTKQKLPNMVHDISLGEIKIETVETSLFINGEDIEDRKYDYKCGFMEYFGIMDLITINSTITKYNIEKLLYSQQCCRFDY